MFAQLFINGLISGAIYSLVALGFALIFGTTRFFHFAHGGVYACAAYLAYFLTIQREWAVVPAACVAVAFSASLGMFIEVAIYRPLRQRQASALILLISSLGVFLIIQNALAMKFGDEQLSLRTGAITEGFDFLGGRITSVQSFIILISVLASTAVFIFLRGNRVGKLMRAVACNPSLATVTGIPVNRIILGAFGLGSALAALAAVLVSLEQDLRPDIGMTALLMGFAAVIVGGVGSIQGAFWGGFLVGLTQSFGIWKLPSMWQNTIVFAFLTAVLLLRPAGLFGEGTATAKV